MAPARPPAHARILSIDARAARRAPGVPAVFTGEDIAAASLGGMPSFIVDAGTLKRPDGEPIFQPPRPAQVRDKVAFVGDYVAFVVADTRDRARCGGADRGRIRTAAGQQSSDEEGSAGASAGSS